jgi:hypothetical protein
MRRDHNSIDGFRNRAKVRVARHAFDFRGVRIYWKRLVPGVAQFAVDGVRWLAGFPRYASDGEALAAEEFGNRLGYVRH